MKYLPCFSPRPAAPKPTRLTLLLFLSSGLLFAAFGAKLPAQSLSFAGAAPAVNFGRVNLCAAGNTTPAPCSETLTLTYKVTDGGTLGAIKLVTGTAASLDFTLASGSTCCQLRPAMPVFLVYLW